ncbi:MAG: glycosyltransferase [Candidatus Eiseniibacteriota bacterium]
MRIVYTSPFLPYPPIDGARSVNWNQVKGLAERGHGLELVVPIRRPEDPANVPHLEQVAAVRAVPVPVRGLWREAVGALARGQSLRVRRHGFAEVSAAMARALETHADLVFLDTVFTAYLLPVVRRVAPAVPVVLHELNVESQVFRRFAANDGRPLLRLGARWEGPRVEEAEQRAWKNADRVLTLSEDDAKEIARRCPGAHVSACAPGIVTYPGEAIPPPADDASVLFLATYRYPPNVDAARWLARSIWPRVRALRPDAVLTIAGQDPAGHTRSLADGRLGIRVLGFVEDAAATVRAAAVVVAPLRVGGGVRLKILEALANERPLVSTALGAEGLPIESGVHASIADGEEAFTGEVARLLGDRAAARCLAAAGRALVEQSFSWTAAIDRLEGILEHVAAQRRSP